MWHRSHSLLRLRIIIAILIVGFVAAPRLSGLETMDTAIITLNAKANAVDLTARYGVTLLDSIPELSKYLVKGTAASLGKLSKDPNFISIEYDIGTEITERAILNESTVALL